MKITVSVSEKLNAKVENQRELLKMSRSEFYQKALRFYLDKGFEKEMIRRINRVCAEADTSVDPAWKAYTAMFLARQEWDAE